MGIQEAGFGGFPAQFRALLKSEPIGGKAGLKVSPLSCGRFAELMLLPPPVWLAQGRSPFWALITLVTEIDNPLDTVTHTGQLPLEHQFSVVMGVAGAIPPFKALTHQLLTGESRGRRVGGEPGN